jgi:hypothetical protein
MIASLACRFLFVSRPHREYIRICTQHLSNLLYVSSYPFNLNKSFIIPASLPSILLAVCYSFVSVLKPGLYPLSVLPFSLIHQCNRAARAKVYVSSYPALLRGGTLPQYVTGIQCNLLDLHNAIT